MTDKNTRIIGRVTRGQSITADHLNKLASGLNAGAQGLRAPGTSRRIEMREYSRTSTTLTIADTAGDTFDIEQIDTITFKDSDGNSWVFKFANPLAE